MAFMRVDFISDTLKRTVPMTVPMCVNGMNKLFS